MLKILLIDDNPDYCKLAVHALAMEGYETEVLTNSAEAVNCHNCLDCKWDAILMDMEMPVIDGYELTKTLRLIGCNRPIIAMTAHVAPDKIRKSRASGCDDVVPKPMDRRKMSEILLRWISVYTQRREAKMEAKS